MKYEGHIKTGDYEYLQFELEGTAEEAVEAYRSLQEAWKGGKGLGMKEFAKIVLEYCKTGAIVNGGDKDFSSNEKLLLGELKKIIRRSN